MSDIFTWLSAILESLPFPFLLPFLGAVFGGEETILIISMISATGGLSFPLVVVFSFLGTMVSDFFWFWFGKRFIGWLELRPKIKNGFDVISAFIDRAARGNHFVALLITKFLYGTRVIMIFYLGREKLSFKKFAAYNTVVTGIWTLVICPIGFLAGRGVIDLVETYHSFELALGALVFVVVIFYGLRIWLNRLIVEGEKR